MKTIGVVRGPIVARRATDRERYRLGGLASSRPVRSKYSCGLAVIVLQEPPEPLSASDWAINHTFRTRCREWDNIVLALVRTFCMIMLDVLAQNMMQRTFTRQNHPCQHFVFDRFHPSFREGIQPRRAWRQRKAFDASVVDDLCERITILGIAVVDEVLTGLKDKPRHDILSTSGQLSRLDISSV